MCKMKNKAGVVINFTPPSAKDTDSSVEAQYTVWVGGTEVNDQYITKVQAMALANVFIDEDYNDVCVFKIKGKL